MFLAMIVGFPFFSPLCVGERRGEKEWEKINRKVSRLGEGEG